MRWTLCRRAIAISEIPIVTGDSITRGSGESHGIRRISGLDIQREFGIGKGVLLRRARPLVLHVDCGDDDVLLTAVEEEDTQANLVDAIRHFPISGVPDSQDGIGCWYLHRAGDRVPQILWIGLGGILYAVLKKSGMNRRAKYLRVATYLSVR